jgi:hypothetical protein
MKKILLKSVFVIGCFLVCSTVANAQSPISFAGQVGYASPQGKYFKPENGNKLSKFGLAVDLDALYHFAQMDNKLGVGLAYNSSILFGADLEGFSNIGLFGVSLYGAKGYYRFSNSKVSPYAALSVGLSHFQTPEMSMNGEVVTKSENAYGFGIRPEVGIEFGTFILSAGYTVPMNYTIHDVTTNAGSLQISLGKRFNLFK